VPLISRPDESPEVSSAAYASASAWSSNTVAVTAFDVLPLPDVPTMHAVALRRPGAVRSAPCPPESCVHGRPADFSAPSTSELSLYEPPPDFGPADPLVPLPGPG
jgi:hypothetical protein